jgi:hypothetical protein
MAHRKKFTLRSSGPFKMMGSSSPIRQEDNDTPKNKIPLKIMIPLKRD